MEPRFNLSGVLIAIRGMDDTLASEFARRWDRYASSETGAPHLEIAVETDARKLDDVAFGSDWRSGLTEGGHPTCEMHEGAIEVETAGRVRARLRTGDTRRRFGGLVTLICAALSWTLPSRGAALLHGAGIVLRGRAFLLIGPEGSGKTTWVGLARAGGARVLSDDLVAVDASGEDAEVLATPFREEQADQPGPGRWPVAAILFPAHGAPARLDDVPDIQVRARLLSNLPFVSDRLASDDRLDGFVTALTASVPVLRLTYDLDSSFLEVLRTRFA